MREDKTWRLVLGATVLGLAIASQALYGEQPGARKASVTNGPRATIGPGIPADLQLPVFPPVKASYTASGAPLEGKGSLALIGPRVLPVWEASDGMDKALTGQICLIDEQCAVCDQCLLYRCPGTPGKCEYTPVDSLGDPTCDDGLFCNGEEDCNVGACEPGASPCDVGEVCDEVADECYAACTADAGCDDVDANTRDTCQPDGVCLHEDIVTLGRCCDADGTCVADNLADCETAGGAFLATDDACADIEPSGNTNDCPDYASGIAPQGAWGPTIGPISNLTCDPLSSLGDDYETADHASLPSDQQFFSVEFLRFVGATYGYNTARWSLDFYDENGVFIESTFWPDLSNDGSRTLAIRTVDFDPPLILPTKGFIVFRVQGNFGLDGRLMMLSTDVVDVGVNDAGRMWTDGGVVNDLLGECTGGDRDEQWCDRRNGNADCTGGGNCDDIPDVLAYELVGTLTSAPLAACCDADEGGCTNRLAWECLAEGNIPQSEGTLCGICLPALTPCDEDADCDPPDVGSCTPIPACDVGACCGMSTGTCTEVPTDAACDDPDGPGPLVGAEEFLGFGTDCDPNCCEQPLSLYTGGDTCADAEVHMINVPPLGAEPAHITITGNNSAATFDDWPDICDDGNFDPTADIKDPGWWEAFELDACATLRLEFCCSDVNGDVWRPVWASLWTACEPCDGINAQEVGVDPPIGIGRETSGFARGAPFCDDDNAWGTYGPLEAGVYYYPMYSAPDGTGAAPPGAQYQINLYVAACPQAACCVGNGCQFLNELECEAAGGYWLHGTVTCGGQSDCDLPDADSPCCVGSCCTGPGECLDAVPGGQPMTEPDCLAEDGTFVGGPLCDDLPPPCPVCEILGDGNCQPYDDQADPILSDRSLPPGGVVVADDFVPQGDTLNRICLWGMYLESQICGLNGNDGNTEGCDCIDHVSDDFLVRVYEDTNDLPGALVEESPVTEFVIGPVEHQFYGDPARDNNRAAQVYEYQMVLDSPIAGLTTGQRYWLEVSNSTPESDTCNWHWMATAFVTNAYTAMGADIEPRYVRGSERGPGTNGLGGDMAFCLDVDLGALPTVDGACCECPADGGACAVEELAACDRGVWEYESTCGGGCDEAWPLGDQCVAREIVVTDQETFIYPFDTWCADMDGSIQETTEAGFMEPGPDIWVHYIAPVDGRFQANTCATGNLANNVNDGAIVVYWDSADHTNCACPDDPNFTRIGLGSDEDCNGIADGGPGRLMTNPVVAAGDCITVRVAGYGDQGAGRGRGTVSIGVEASDCTFTNTPILDPRVGDFGSGTRNRYLSFSTGSPGMSEAMRVTFVDLPPPFDAYNGDRWWVAAPVQVTEASGSDAETPLPAYWAATLQCSDPHYDDWSQYGVVHVYNAGIVAGASYEIQAISDDCNASVEDNYSPPVTINTSGFGDIVGDCGIQPCGPPQGVIDFVDISGCVDKFRNLPTAPQKARADVINSNITQAPPDRKVDFVDISAVVDAFRGSPPPLPGPQNHCP